MQKPTFPSLWKFISEYSVLLIIGFVAAIGFTVSLFIAAVAFPPGLVQDAAKMGALFSFGAVFVSLGVAKIIGVKKIR